jgi:predicted acylesterase/phospholipase RssA
MSADEAKVVTEAGEILRGAYKKPADILDIAKRLKNFKQFGYARRILARARKDPAINDDAKKRLEIHQQSALCTYKDPDLPLDRRLDRALEILRSVEDLSATNNTETLGITGAIYKRKWEVDNQRAQLERSLYYYQRGYEASAATGQEADLGYNGINAAYILDLLAHKEAEEADKAGIPPGGDDRKRIEGRRAQAKRIREEIVEKVAPLLTRADTNWLQGKWWFYSTVAEAYFGLGPYNAAYYDEAVKWLTHGITVVADVPEWERESTVRQLASIARLQAKTGVDGARMEETPAWRALEKLLGEETAAVRSAFYGKIGLGLSGGGFRASLFHIGVLAKLAELDVLRRVEVLSCVSGGSIIGAHYYLEVRKLLRQKEDKEITREDYIEIVERVEREFLAGVQRNVRMRVAAEPWTNLKMIFGADTRPWKWIFGPSYSRTMRAGELFESEIFSRVKDREGDKPRWINDMKFTPKGEDASFRPKYHNWRREAKVPILILNAATLNTGHTWHFTASYMGEPPAGIDSEIDGNDRLRRIYYDEAPEGHRCVRLGHAVAASACVPGLFEPIAFDKLYPERVVRLIDGGTCDNQGIGGLLEQDCNVLLISDGSGQMESIKDPSRGLLGVPLRSTSILQARVRQAQYQDLSSRKRSQLLRGFMFVHLKEDLDVDPVDWVDCLDPYDADDDDARPASRKGKLTRYGISKEMQQQLASVRTDLDSFSDVEAYALMTSAYRMTEHAFGEGKCVEGFDAPAKPVEWDFLAVEGGMKGAGKPYQYVKRLLDVSDMLAFKIWKLKKFLQVTAVLLAIAIAVVGVWAVWKFWDTELVKAITVGTLGALIISMALTALGTALVGKRLMRVVRLRETLIRAAIGLSVGILGWLAAWLHLAIFDKMFLKEGSIKKYKGQFKSAATCDNGGAQPPPDSPRVAQDREPERLAEPTPHTEAVLPQSGAVVSESVAVRANVEALPLPGATDATEDEPFPESIDVRDSDARKE